MRYSGLTKCKVDSAGRIRLPQRVIDDLLPANSDSAELVLYCLPEGALALFTVQTWQLIRSKTPEETPDLLTDLELRRRSRRIAANSDSVVITAQGRITVPPLFREKLGFSEGAELIVTGNERGYEIWNSERWAKEMALDEEALNS